MPKQLEIFPKINFLYKGLVSLTCWNSIISSLDFFNLSFVGYNCGFYLPIPYVIATNIFSFLMPLIAQKFSYNIRIISSIIVMILV